MHGRFGRHFGPPGSREGWEGWTPPWLQPDWQGPRGPRFFRGGPGPGFGPRGPFGFGGQWGSPEFQALRTEAAEVARLFAIASRGAGIVASTITTAYSYDRRREIHSMDYSRRLSIFAHSV